jgi:hypothetical protein
MKFFSIFLDHVIYVMSKLDLTGKQITEEII